MGAERKNSVVPVTTRSVFERGFSAVRMPTGRAIAIQMMNAPSATAMLAGNRDMISSRTGTSA